MTVCVVSSSRTPTAMSYSSVVLGDERVGNSRLLVINNMAKATSPIYKTWCTLLDKEKEGGFDSLSDEEKNFYCVYLLEHETYGGGLEVWLDQGKHHNQAATALRKIGADKSARIIENVMKFV